MGFGTFDDIIKALSNGQSNLFPLQKLFTAAANVFSSMWVAPGVPGGGVISGTALTAVQQLGTTPGGLSFPDPPAGKTRHLFHASAGGPTGVIYLLDRLLVYPGIDHTSNALQTFINSVTLPRYTDGVGVMACLEVSTPLGTGTPTVTFTYRNSLGQAQVTTFALVVSSTVNSILPSGRLFIPLVAGDVGIQQATSIQLSAGQTAGVSTLVLFRVLGSIPTTSNSMGTRDFITQVSSLERLYNGHCIMAAGVFPAVVTNGNVIGHVFSAYN